MLVEQIRAAQFKQSTNFLNRPRILQKIKQPVDNKTYDLTSTKQMRKLQGTDVEIVNSTVRVQLAEIHTGNLPGTSSVDWLTDKIS